jgi:hypothetical protein
MSRQNSVHCLGESADRLFPAPARRAVGNDRDLLDAGFLDALDLRAALGDRAGADDERLPRQNFVSCVTRLDLQFTTPHNHVFGALRRLTRLAPTKNERITRAMLKNRENRLLELGHLNASSFTA